MPVSQSRPISIPWLLAVAGSGTLVFLAALPPWLGEGASSAVRAGFSFFCHQIPERSFHIDGEPFAVCHRDFGILTGLAIGASLVGPFLSSSVRGALIEGRRPGTFLLLSVLPTAVDWFVGTAGIWSNTPFSRFSTGALFGLTAGVLLASAFLGSRQEQTMTAPFPSSLTYHPT